MQNEDDILVWKRALRREKLARRQAEEIMESKSLALYESNEKLKALNQNLEDEVRKRTHEIAQKEFEYKSLVESATEVIFKIDVSGNFVYINPVASRLSGYDADELIGRNFAEFIHPAHVKRVFDFYNQQIKDRQPISELEFPIISRDGRELWFKQSATLILKEGVPVEFVAVAHNITEVKIAQEAVAESEEKYRGMIENLELGVIEVSPQGVIQRAYTQFCKLTGFSEKELIGEQVGKLYATTSNRTSPELVLEELLGNEMKEYSLTKKNGEKAWFLISGAPFFNLDGHKVGSVLIHLDISKRKLMEYKLRESNRKADRLYKIKEQFFANVSHEIRTPMNAIIGMAELLNETALNAKQNTYLHAIQSSSKSLLVLVNDMLDFSKMESGKLTLEHIPVSIEEVVGHVQQMMALKADDNGVEVLVSYDRSLPRMLLTDRTRLEQVLLNLVGNAIKFTTNGFVKITAKVVRARHGKVDVRFEVMDNGIGISKAHQDKIFQSFTQATDSTSRLFGGTGLGLTISREIVRLLGGDLAVESKEGKGSTFYFTLTLDQVNEVDVTPNEESSEQRDFDGARILVVEDNPINRLIVCSNLENWNCEFEQAENGKEAVDWLKKSVFDLVLMDVRMPVMGGMEATAIIRQEIGLDTPIIALTGNAVKGDKERYLGAGMNDYLAKPFEKIDLNKKLSAFLNSTASSKSLVNLTGLQGLGDEDFVQRMVDLFISEVGDDVQRIKVGITQLDEKLVRDLLHKIKPSTKYVCDPHIYHLVLDLEEEKETVKLFEKTTQLLHKLESVITELQAM